MFEEEEEDEAPTIPGKRGFEDKHVVPKNDHRDEVELELAAVGMRKRDFLVFAVDVYLAGCYVSPFTLFQIKSCVRNDDLESIVETVLADSSASTSSDGKTVVSPSAKPHICMILRFERDVAKEDTITAFTGTFAGLPEEEIAVIAEELDKRLDEEGTKAGDEVIFYWLQGGGLIITQNGELAPTYGAPSVERRLLEVYLHPERTVAPELLEYMKATMDED